MFYPGAERSPGKFFLDLGLSTKGDSRDGMHVKFKVDCVKMELIEGVPDFPCRSQHD